MYVCERAKGGSDKIEESQDQNAGENERMKPRQVTCRREYKPRQSTRLKHWPNLHVHTQTQTQTHTRRDKEALTGTYTRTPIGTQIHTYIVSQTAPAVANPARSLVWRSAPRAPPRALRPRASERALPWDGQKQGIMAEQSETDFVFCFLFAFANMLILSETRSHFGLVSRRE